ncbi:MAG: hypothetical protein MUO82_06390 [Candidatus Thermoplasmatota archaeon]|nr:hypothetical protein [Candidatus Thermoplasmatota archaeon]
MKRIFYGAAIQGAKDRKERSYVHEFFIKTIKKQGFEVCTEHTTGKTYEEAIKKLEKAIGLSQKMNFNEKYMCVTK